MQISANITNIAKYIQICTNILIYKGNRANKNNCIMTTLVFHTMSEIIQFIFQMKYMIYFYCIAGSVHSAARSFMALKEFSRAESVDKAKNITRSLDFWPMKKQDTGNPI